MPQKTTFLGAMLDWTLKEGIDVIATLTIPSVMTASVNRLNFS